MFARTHLARGVKSTVAHLPQLTNTGRENFLSSILNLKRISQPEVKITNFCQEEIWDKNVKAHCYKGMFAQTLVMPQFFLLSERQTWLTNRSQLHGQRRNISPAL